MRPRVLAFVIAGLLITIASYLCKPAPVEPPVRRERPTSRDRPSPVARGAAAANKPVLRRNLFEYGGASGRAPVPAVAPRAATEAPPPPTPTRAPVKLVGVLEQAKGLRAAIAIEGDLVLAEAGQRVGSYTVVSIDVNEGVVLTAPDGQELWLRPSPQ